MNLPLQKEMMTQNHKVCTIYLHFVAYALTQPMQTGVSDPKEPSHSDLRTQMLKLPPSALHFCKKKEKKKSPMPHFKKRATKLVISLFSFLLVFFDWREHLNLPFAVGATLLEAHATHVCERGACAVVQPRLWMSYSCTARWSAWTADEWSGNY